MDSYKNMTAFVTALNTNETPGTHGSALVVWSYGTTCLEHDLTWFKVSLDRKTLRGGVQLNAFQFGLICLSMFHARL
jgi:hypothetical protein